MLCLPAAPAPLPGGRVLPAQQFPQVLISVSKRSFKRAVDRNRIKRQIREAYRLNRDRAFERATVPLPAAIGIIFVGKEILESDFISDKMSALLRRIAAGKTGKEK